MLKFIRESIDPGQLIVGASFTAKRDGKEVIAEGDSFEIFETLPDKLGHSYLVRINDGKPVKVSESEILEVLK